MSRNNRNNDNRRSALSAPSGLGSSIYAPTQTPQTPQTSRTNHQQLSPLANEFIPRPFQQVVVRLRNVLPTFDHIEVQRILSQTSPATFNNHARLRRYSDAQAWVILANQAEFQALDRQIEVHQNTRDMDGRKILELQQEAEDARKRCQEEKKALKTKLDDATRAKEALETEVQELEQDDVERSSKLEATQKELDNANRELEHLQEKAKKAAEACEKEKKQLSGQLEDERDRFQKEKGALIGQRNALRKQIISEEELRQKAEGDLEVAQTQKRCLQEELVKRYEEEMTALRRQIDQTTEDYTELEESELEHTLAFTKLVRDYDESIEEIASLQKDIRRTQEGVRSMKTERTASINAARNLVEALRPLIEQSHADHQAAFQAFSDAIPKTETDARKSNTQIGVRGASDTGYDGDDEGKVDDSAFA